MHVARSLLVPGRQKTSCCWSLELVIVLLDSTDYFYVLGSRYLGCYYLLAACQVLVEATWFRCKSALVTSMQTMEVGQRNDQQASRDVAGCVRQQACT